jgi:hypothetical protein
MRSSATLAAVLIPAVLVLLSGCSGNLTGDEEATLDNPFDCTEPVGKEKGGPSTYGNCLSMPVIFAEGHGLTGDDVAVFSGLRGTIGVEHFAEPYDDVTLIDGRSVYRNPSVNEWQADWVDGRSWGDEIPVELDWADNLTRRTWNERSKVRVEIVLSTVVDPVTNPLLGYSMYSLGGTQRDEVFVTNTARYTAASATVYSNVARLQIEKLNKQGGEPVSTIYDSRCYEGYFVDGPSNAYSGEVNMAGKCIYGYNWDVGEVPLDDKTGWYRLTFSLDDNVSYSDDLGNSYAFSRNTVITGLNPGDLLGYNDPEVVSYPPTLGQNGHASILEVYIKARSTGRR